MKATQQQTKGLGLCSGGLDSILAGVLLTRQGVEVKWITFETPFFSSHKAIEAANQTGIPLIQKDITPRYLDMLKHPNAGYGKNMNPCMDCHALMFTIANEVRMELGYDFLFSGEVVGQRPMSQNKHSLNYVKKHAGAGELIIRPLSAKLLPPSQPEIMGWVDREQLLDISGRSRKRQIQLAREWGIKKYPNPAGGCALTDKGFSQRLKDLFAHDPDFTFSDLYLLNFGRHFRLDDGVKMIIGRTDKDNQGILQHYQAQTAVKIKILGLPGPICLLPRKGTHATIRLAAAACAGYTKAPQGSWVKASVCQGGVKEVIDIQVGDTDAYKAYLL